MVHNCCSSLVQEGSLAADLHMAEVPVCSSHNHHPDGKNGAEDPASDPSPCHLSAGAAVGNRHRVESMAHSEVEALLVDIHMVVVENVAPTEKLDHDPEGGDVAAHIHQIEMYFLQIPV